MSISSPAIAGSTNRPQQEVKYKPRHEQQDRVAHASGMTSPKSPPTHAFDERGEDDEADDTEEEEDEDEDEDEGEDGDGDGDDEENSDDGSSTGSFPVAKTPMNSLVSLVEEKEDVGHKDADWYNTGKQPEQLASVREVEEEDYMDIEDSWDRGNPVNGYRQEPGRSDRSPSYPPNDLSSVLRMPYSPTNTGPFEVPRGSIGGSSTGMSAGTTSTAGRTISSLHSQAALLFSRNKKAPGGTNKDLGNLFDLTSNRSHQTRRPKNGLPALEPLRFLRPNGNQEIEDDIDPHRDVEAGIDPFKDDGAMHKDPQDLSAELGSHSQHSSDKSYNDPVALAVLESADQKERDQRRLEQLGYSQDLGRDYGFWACFSVGFCNIGSLQGSLFGIFTTYSYGGPQMILIMWPIAGLALLFMTLAMGELASAYPVAGAMSSWAWTCARKGIGGERAWGWVMGGLVMGYHVGVMCLISWQSAKLVNETIHLAIRDYLLRDWVTALFSMALMAVFGFVGTSKWGRSPRFWVMSCIYILSVWAVLCISLLATRDKVPAQDVIYGAPFRNNSGWNSKPYIYLVGAILSTIATGSDACAHLAEETRNPARIVPLAMVTSVVASYIVGYVCILIILLSIHPSWVNDIARHEFPTGQILKRTLGLGPAIAILSLCVVALCLQATAQLQASSRFVWALARDQAIPFSKYFYALNKHRLPVAATWLVLAMALPMAAIIWTAPHITSSVLSTAAGTFCMVSYSAPTLLYLLSRNDLAHEYRSSWSLRWLSKPIGCLAVFSAATVITAMAFPTGYPVTAETLSWSPITTASALVLSYVTWKLYGESHYSGPIRSITKWTAGAEIDLRSALQNPNPSSPGQTPDSRRFPGQTESEFFSPSTVHLEMQGRVDAGANDTQDHISPSNSNPGVSR